MRGGLRGSIAGVSGSSKVMATAGFFVLGLATVVLSAATHRGLPLFFAWAPLVGVGWILTRPETGEEPPSPDEPPSDDD
jgi:hypothetical protein